MQLNLHTKCVSYPVTSLPTDLTLLSVLLTYAKETNHMHKEWTQKCKKLKNVREKVFINLW